MHPLYRHILRNNQVHWGLYRPLTLAGQAFGMVHEKVAESLLASGHILPEKDALRLANEPSSVSGRSEALRAVLHQLIKNGLVAKERHELYSVATSFKDEPLALADRALMPALGFKAYGVHCNGFVREGRSFKLWVGRRALDSATEPGKLDHMIAGGQPHGLSVMDNLAKEAHEEAGVPPALAAAARPVSSISYNLGSASGIRRDTLFVFDLEVPPDFTPRNQDGEVQGFTLMRAEDVLENLFTRDDFKFNVNLVLIDFFIRHGMIRPDEPGYHELCLGLRQPHG